MVTCSFAVFLFKHTKFCKASTLIFAVKVVTNSTSFGYKYWYSLLIILFSEKRTLTNDIKYQNFKFQIVPAKITTIDITPVKFIVSDPKKFSTFYGNFNRSQIVVKDW